MTSRDHFGPLPEAAYDGTTRSGKFLDVEIIGTIYVGGDATISGDITTDNLTATGGTLGGLTITGELTVQDYLTLGTGGVLRTAASGQRIQLTFTDKNVMHFFSGDVSEDTPGSISETTVGAGVTRTIQFGMYTPKIDVDDYTGTFVVRSGSPDGTSYAPGFVFGKTSGGGAETGMPLEFRIQNSIPLITDGDVTLSAGDITLTSGVFGSTALGSAAATVFGIGSNYDDGIYSPADSQLGFVTAGTEAFKIDSNGNIIGNTMAMVGIDYIRAGDGSAGAPTYTFTSDPNTGMYWVTDDQLGFSTGGTARVSITGTRTDIDTVFLQLPVKATTGDPSSPQNGDCYVNTFDNKIRVYADAAWRDLATW